MTVTLVHGPTVVGRGWGGGDHGVDTVTTTTLCVLVFRTVMVVLFRETGRER